MSSLNEAYKSNKNMDKKVSLTMDENAKYTIHNLNIMQLPKLELKYCRAEEIEQRSMEYFMLCNQDNMKPTAAGYALALGVSRAKLIDYVQGKTALPKDNKATLEKYYSVLNALIEDYMSGGKINPVSGIFMMKNSFGYRDQQEIVTIDNKETESTPEALIEESNLMMSGIEKKKADIEVGDRLERK